MVEETCLLGGEETSMQQKKKNEKDPWQSRVGLSKLKSLVSSRGLGLLVLFFFPLRVFLPQFRVGLFGER